MPKEQWRMFVKKSDDNGMRIVIDTNVLISYFWGSRNAESIVNLMFSGTVMPVVSEAMLRELVSVGKRGKFRERFSQKVFQDLTEAYRNVSLVIVPKRKIIISADKKDDIFLECAVEGCAGYIISGDRHLLDIGTFEDVRITTPADFLALIS
jgi:uncharacterized protein